MVTDHPRLAQFVFAVLVVLDTVLRFGDVDDPGAGVWSALGLLALVTAVVGLAPISWRPATAAVVAVADLAVIGLARLDPQTSGSAVLVALPAMYLGRYLGRRGVVVTGVASLALVAVPNLVYTDFDGPAASRTLLSVAIAVVVALAIATMVEEMRRHRRVGDAIVDAVPVGLVLLERDGFRTLNVTQERFMRLAYPGTTSDAERIGRDGLVFGPDGRTPLPEAEWPHARLRRGEEFDDLRLWVGDDPATRCALSTSGRVVLDDQGRPAGGSLAFSDVTGFVRAMEVKDEFVSSVSHELRTPLTSIKGYALMILDDDDLEPLMRKQVQVIARNADRLHRLVGDLLDTAQTDAGTAAIVREETDLAAVVVDVVESAMPAAQQAGVILSVRAPGRLDAFVDPLRVGQVLDNLISNALKHTARFGEVRVTLAEETDRAVITVHDNGVGIEAQDRDRLFLRFYRSRASEESAVPGVGLGLSIVQAIVVAHGGRVEVESEVGVGTTFRVRLPLRAAETRSIVAAAV